MGVAENPVGELLKIQNGKVWIKVYHADFGSNAPRWGGGGRQCQCHCNYNEFPQRIVRYSNSIRILFLNQHNSYVNKDSTFDQFNNLTPLTVVSFAPEKIIYSLSALIKLLK